MGLDGVELVLEIEDEFGIHIPDEEASQTITMADVFLLVCRLRGVGPAAKRPDDDGQLQAILRDMGLRQSLSDPEPLSDLVPADRRHEFWRRVEQARRPGLPALKPPIGCGAALAIIAAGAILGVIGGPIGIALGALLGVVTGVLLRRQTLASRPNFPPDLQTVQDLMTWWRPVSSSAEIWSKIVEITANQVGVAKEDIHPETRLVDDLKIGR